MGLHVSLRRVTALLCAVLGTAMLALASAAGAATINVTTTTDEFDSGSRCSLREAIWSANNDSGAMADGCQVGSAGRDQINVPPGRFNLTRFNQAPMGVTAEDANLYGDLDVTGPTTIVHAGIRPAVIHASVFGERVFHTRAPGGVTLQGLTISSGHAASGSENRGGGILNEGSLTVRNSSLQENNAVFGGGLSTEGDSAATLINVTISGNDASEDGGGVSAETGGTVALRSVTVSGNRSDSDGSGGGDGAGLFASTSGGGGAISLRNTLVGGNTDSGGEAHDCAKLGGTITSLGQNMITNTNGCDYQRGTGDVLNRSAQILPRIDNGGPTQTHALKRTSPAINKGASCPSTDQRGVRRKIGGRCDIGSWELARCRGVVINKIGTGGPELLIGTPTADGILGLGGPDVIQGVDGNDGLCGGGGGDRLEGGLGSDQLDGGPGRDTCLPGRGLRGRPQSAVNCELPRR